MLFFLDRIFSTFFSLRGSYTCGSDYSVYDGGGGDVHTLTCCTHIFLLHSLPAHIRTSSCVSQTRMAQVS